MTDTRVRLFRVHARRLATSHGHLVSESSFEAAAVVWLEGWPGETGTDTTVSIIVRDLDSGLEHCFGIDLDAGAVAPCD
jgi:hypothetical protein